MKGKIILMSLKNNSSLRRNDEPVIASVAKQSPMLDQSRGLPRLRQLADPRNDEF